MARLIPSFIDDHAPPGERDVFHKLAAGPEDWVVLHSLDLSPWNRSLRTEIDFVVIAPDTGILCLEIKSHERIAFENDRWFPATIKRSPFQQAADARFAFYRRLRDLAPEFAAIPVVHACVFPRARFDLRPNVAVTAWELMDARAFQALATGLELCRDLQERMLAAIRHDRNLRPLPARLTPARIEAILACCLPVQRRRPEAREEIARREEHAGKMLREQQRPVLQLAALNHRLIVAGGAGTGKTLIALELARRAAERGKRVALLCFNRLVGAWMAEQVARLSPSLPNLVVGRAIQIMAEMTDVKFPHQPSPEFWENDLPQLLEDRLTDPDLKAVATFDYLVLDEAQDILARPRLWQCLSHFLAGGLEGGSFVLLGDFHHQVLAERGGMEETLAALEATVRPARWHLGENCRNYRIVGETAARLGGFGGAVYSGYLRDGGGVQNYDITFYESERAQLDRIKAWLGEFRALGYQPAEITLLSFRAGEASAAAKLRREGHQFRPAGQAGGGTAHATVHAFKGMENKVIILTDLAPGGPEFHRHLFYTGLTRATECVRVLCDHGAKATLLGWMKDKTD